MSPTPLNRRKVLGAAGLAGAAATFTTGSAAHNDDARTWRMVTSWPKGAPGVGTAAQRLADLIGQMSGGRLTVTLYGAGELVPPFEVFDAVATGTAEMGHGASHFWAGKDPAFSFFTGLPFGLTAVERLGWLRFGGGQALWDETYAPFGIQAFFAGSSGVQAGGWFRAPLTSLDDLKGLKMRIAGLGGEVLRRLGVTVTLLDGAGGYAPGRVQATGYRQLTASEEERLTRLLERANLASLPMEERRPVELPDGRIIVCADGTNYVFEELVYGRRSFVERRFCGRSDPELVALINHLEELLPAERFERYQAFPGS